MATGMNDIVLKVSPEKMVETAAEIKVMIDKAKADFDSIINKVASTAHYWQGIAAETYQTDFKEEQPEFEEAFKRLSEHVVDLHNMAAVYTGAEQMATNLAESLLSNVIE